MIANEVRLPQMLISASRMRAYRLSKVVPDCCRIVPAYVRMARIPLNWFSAITNTPTKRPRMAAGVSEKII